MIDKNGEKNKTFVSLTLGDGEGRIEKLGAGVDGVDHIRLSSWSNGQTHPLDLTEKELGILLQRAIRAGILSIDFLNDLHTVIEI